MLATAAEMAVPLPLSKPVMDVLSVMAGVVVAVATVPAKPLAETTDTLVTVPLVAGFAQVGAPPVVAVSTWPVVPAAVATGAAPAPPP